MSAEKVATVPRIYDGWASGDLAQARSLIDAHVEVHPDPESAWPGIEPVHHGHTCIARYLESIYAAFEGYHAEPEDLIDVGDPVLVLAIERGRGRFGGAAVEIRDTAQIWTLRGGKATRLDVNWDRERASAEVG